MLLMFRKLDVFQMCEILKLFLKVILQIQVLYQDSEMLRSSSTTASNFGLCFRNQELKMYGL